MKIRRKHTISILWKSGHTTRHLTTNLTVTRAVGGTITKLEWDYLHPPITSCDPTQVVAVVRGRV